MTTQERFARRRKKLEEKLTRLDLQEARTLQREQAHDEQIARDLAGVPGHFAHGLNFYKLFWVFFLCCFLGVVIETIFCWIASGRLSQRTGLVWGPFNLIYGIGAVLLTVCLHPFIGKSDRWIFIGGSIIGGAFEYFCSWLQETVLGTVSWDYTGYPFNLNGRINLLYCLFWGALALGERGISTAERLYRTARFQNLRCRHQLGAHRIYACELSCKRRGGAAPEPAL